MRRLRSATFSINPLSTSPSSSRVTPEGDSISSSARSIRRRRLSLCPVRGAERLEVVERETARAQHLRLELPAAARYALASAGRKRIELDGLLDQYLTAQWFILYYCLRTQAYTTNQGRAMSTTEQQTSTTAFRPAPGTWIPVHSSIGFAVSTAGVGTFRGTFDEFDAQRSSTVASKASPRSPASESTTRTSPATCRAPDFFDAEQYPELRFVSKSIERDGDDVSIQGDLTIRGVTHPVEIAGTVVGAARPNAYGRAADRFRPGDDGQPPAITGSPGTWSSRAAARRSATTSHHRQPRVGAGVIR